MDAPPVADTLLDEATALAQRAGAATLDWFQSSTLTIDVKGDGSPVTEADRFAERLIRRHLAEHHGADTVIGEEEQTTEGSSGHTWYIDPIDGTRAFVHGIPLFANLIAVMDENGPAVGVINLPALGDTISAGRGLGCFWNGSPCRVRERTTLDDAMVSTSDYRDLPNDVLNRLHAKQTHLLTWGDAYGYALVATGRLDAMIDPVVNAWDIAPMAVILAEAGGRFSDFAGAADIDSGSAVATNGTIHDELLEILAGD